MNEPTKSQLICDAKRLLQDINQYFYRFESGDIPREDYGLALVRRELKYFITVNPPVKENLTTEKEKV
jgi:hypothetical protein